MSSHISITFVLYKKDGLVVVVVVVVVVIVVVE